MCWSPHAYDKSEANLKSCEDNAVKMHCILYGLVLAKEIEVNKMLAEFTLIKEVWIGLLYIQIILILRIFFIFWEFSRCGEFLPIGRFHCSQMTLSVLHSPNWEKISRSGEFLRFWTFPLADKYWHQLLGNHNLLNDIYPSMLPQKRNASWGFILIIIYTYLTVKQPNKSIDKIDCSTST